MQLGNVSAQKRSPRIPAGVLSAILAGVIESEGGTLNKSSYRKCHRLLSNEIAAIATKKTKVQDIDPTRRRSLDAILGDGFL